MFLLRQRLKLIIDFLWTVIPAEPTAEEGGLAQEEASTVRPLPQGHVRGHGALSDRIRLVCNDD